jgi:hypothetical protein|tara:strand:- start:695 stop:955 length:261 start_codon:yes stop_codon:yes gene_type:complete
MANKKDIGNLHNVFNSGIDLDPENKLSLNTDKEKGQKAFYKGKPMKYMDYIQEVGDRIKRNKEGRGIENGSKFAGVNFDINGNIIK